MVRSCRFYEKKFPDKDEVVMVNVRSIAEMGAYVTLLEYNNIEGMILLSELSRRRIRSINKLVRVGRNEAVMVLRVDQDKGYIDLSKRRVSPEDLKACEDKFQKAKQVNSILRHVADLLDIDMEKLSEETAWKLAKVYGNMYEAFKRSITEPEEVFAHCPDLDPKTKEVLLSVIQRRLTSQPIKIRADIDVQCYEYAGIDAIKEALHAGIAKGNQNSPVKINLVAAPTYVITAVSLDKDEGVELVTSAIEVIKQKIESLGGTLDVKHAARAVNASEENKSWEDEAKDLSAENSQGEDDDEDDDDQDDE